MTSILIQLRLFDQNNAIPQMVVSQNQKNLHMRYYFLLLFLAPGARNRNLTHRPPLRNSFIALFYKLMAIIFSEKYRII
jgi:hypothetical protein